MKKMFIISLFASLFCCNEALAQDVLLPYNEPWNAKYLYSNVGTSNENWFETNFSDSTWNNIKGPIMGSTAWREYGSTYCLRRHFVVEDVTNYWEGEFYLLYDCDGVAYLNGKKIYEWNGYKSSWNTIFLDKAIMETIHKGDNVLAVRVSDNGGDSFIDFGLCGWKEPRKYTELHEAVDSLQRRLNGNTANALPLTVAEATKLLEETQTAMSSFEYNNTKAEEMTRIVNSIITRLNYNYIDIKVTIPGSMGDSILKKVENFADVASIKLSGVLNDADITTIQSRLTNLREIDMTDIKMETIPNRFFYQRSSIQKVFLPKGLLSIGEYAFYQCRGIDYIVFPPTLTTINRYAFSECDNIQEVILPESLATLGEYAFYSCDNNQYVKFPSTLKTINSYTFYYNVKLKKVDFAEGLTHINSNAFSRCSVLESLKFPNTLYYIGDNAFSYNSSLSIIEFNEGLYQIADNAFYDCDALTEITLPSSLVLANASPFDYCDNLKKVICLSIDPPYMTDQIPYGLGMEGRELYVPALSINTYKQTMGWDKFPTIKPLEYLPENFTVLGDLKLTLPETIPADYKPNVSIIHDQKGTSYWQYGSLTVNGKGTLSMSDFSMIWDPNYQIDQPNRIQNYCSLVNNSHLRADKVYISIWTRNNRWTFLSLPFDVKVSDIMPIAEGTTNWVIRKYDGQRRAAGETSEYTWIKMRNDDVLNAGEGYIIQGSRYIGTSSQSHSGFLINSINNENKNNIFINTDATVTLKEYESEFAHNRSWNFIGNPYPCYYDTRFMDFEAPITVWNMNNSTYAAYSPVDDSYILSPGEAFFVQCPVDKNTIVFNKDGRQINNTVRTIENPANAKAKLANEAIAKRTIINLNLSDGNHSDRTRIVINDKASLLYEMDKDASKFMSTEPNVPQIYTSTNGVDYAINERPFADGTVNVGASIGAERTYTIALANDVEGYQVTLEDKAEHKKTLLKDGNEYVFSAKAGTYNGRFVLHFSNETTGIEEVSTNTQGNTDTYSIEGIKVSSPTKKGIYIQNGKKIMLNK